MNRSISFATYGSIRAGSAGGSGGRGRFRRLPFAGGWTRHRDFPVPERDTFQAQWRQRLKQQARRDAETKAEGTT